MHISLGWERPRSFRVPPIFAAAKKDSCMNLVFGTFKERRSHNFRLSQKRFMHESFFGTSEKGKDSCMNL